LILLFQERKERENVPVPPRTKKKEKKKTSVSFLLFRSRAGDNSHINCFKGVRL
jgi:hypothetical protein